MPTVLIVDDSEAIRSLSCAMLQALGLNVETADNGLQALEICKRKMPDAILLDWNMPIMDGPIFQQQLRAMPNGKWPKVIYCSVEDEYERIAVAMTGGADGFIIKPFTLETLSYNLGNSGIIPKPVRTQQPPLIAVNSRGRA